VLETCEDTDILIHGAELVADMNDDREVERHGVGWGLVDAYQRDGETGWSSPPRWGVQGARPVIGEGRLGLPDVA
jgi:hypothetical protein